MNKFKIKTNERTYDKAVELLSMVGVNVSAQTGKEWVLGDLDDVVSSYSNWDGLSPKWVHDYKEITIAELRDMVVLKRNDVNDATHQDKGYAEFKYRLINNQWHVITDSNQVWRKSSMTLEESPFFIKPIEKTMKKEYLIPSRNYEYILTDAREGLEPHAKDWIEIPEGAEFAVLNGDNEIDFYTGLGLEKSHFIPTAIIWQRPTQPEALPFIDDEPQSLNDQYTEIEQIRQHSHYKKDVSNLEFVDVYRVLKLFDVTDPCLQHAIKKLLCSGQRGAKSSDQDVQEAIDSLVRFQQMRIEDTLD